jgi:hypothetical protein
MTSDTQKHSPSAGSAAGDKKLHDLQQANLGPLQWLGTAWAAALAEMGTEVMSFVADRVREDVKTQHEILHCKDLSELQTIQAAFLERAFVQYTVETGKLIDIGSSVLPVGLPKTNDTPV